MQLDRASDKNLMITAVVVIVGSHSNAITAFDDYGKPVWRGNNLPDSFFALRGTRTDRVRHGNLECPTRIPPVNFLRPSCTKCPLPIKE
jgi:hypothetical protein